jgi:hypothetical protein
MLFSVILGVGSPGEGDVVAFGCLDAKELRKPGDVELEAVTGRALATLLDYLLNGLVDIVCKVRTDEKVPSDSSLLVASSLRWPGTEWEVGLQNAVEYDAGEINVVSSNTQ